MLPIPSVRTRAGMLYYHTLIGSGVDEKDAKRKTTLAFRHLHPDKGGDGVEFAAFLEAISPPVIGPP